MSPAPSALTDAAYHNVRALRNHMLVLHKAHIVTKINELTGPPVRSAVRTNSSRPCLCSCSPGSATQHITTKQTQKVSTAHLQGRPLGPRLSAGGRRRESAGPADRRPLRWPVCRSARRPRRPGRVVACSTGRRLRKKRGRHVTREMRSNRCCGVQTPRRAHIRTKGTTLPTGACCIENRGD